VELDLVAALALFPVVAFALVAVLASFLAGEDPLVDHGLDLVVVLVAHPAVALAVSLAVAPVALAVA